VRLAGRGSVEERLAAEDLGTAKKILCREPWESYYILRRGILPCCHGSRAIAPLEDWKTAWNSPAMQEIRSHLAKGRLSPYCFDSTGCPLVQRHFQEIQQRVEETQRQERWLATRFPVLRTMNRLLGHVPGKAYGRLFRALRSL
jgi:hypothetical protein